MWLLLEVILYDEIYAQVRLLRILKVPCWSGKDNNLLIDVGGRMHRFLNFNR